MNTFAPTSFFVRSLSARCTLRIAMNPIEVLRIVDAIHRDKNIEKEIVFQALKPAA